MAVKLMYALLGFMATVLIEHGGYLEALDGQCPDYPLMSDFDPKQIIGNWIGTRYITEGRDYDVYSCMTAKINISDTGFLKMTQYFAFRDEKYSYTVRGPRVNKDQPGKWKVEESKTFGLPQILTILATDYNNYVAFVLCGNEKKDKFSYAVFVLSHQVNISEESLNAAKEAIANAGINEQLQEVVHDDEIC